MNDFTKQELQFLYECLDDEISTFRLAHNHYCTVMRDKIREMIDNYCDHIPYDYPKYSTAIPMCKLCGAFI
jgi:hypothetical protein